MQSDVHGVLLVYALGYCVPPLPEGALRISFCARHDSISPTIISFGLRQSIMPPTSTPAAASPARPNPPRTLPPPPPFPLPPLLSPPPAPPPSPLPLHTQPSC